MMEVVLGLVGSLIGAAAALGGVTLMNRSTKQHHDARRKHEVTEKARSEKIGAYVEWLCAHQDIIAADQRLIMASPDNREEMMDAQHAAIARASAGATRIRLIDSNKDSWDLVLRVHKQVDGAVRGTTRKPERRAAWEACRKEFERMGDHLGKRFAR